MGAPFELIDCLLPFPLGQLEIPESAWVLSSNTRAERSFIYAGWYNPGFDSIEHGRVLVIPDAGSLTEPPFVCLASSLKQRLSETNIIGGRDTLLSFETSGVLVFFDHHDGVVTLHPQTN